MKRNMVHPGCRCYRQRLAHRTRSQQARGFSLLELLVTILLLAMVSLAVLKLMHHVQLQTGYLNERLTRQSNLQFSLDKLLNDIIASNNAESIRIENLVLERADQIASHVTISSVSGADSDKALKTIEWVSVPRWEERDLVLFRRAANTTQQEEAEYIPMCEHLYSFSVELVEPNEALLVDPNRAVSWLEIEAQVYQPGEEPDPERVVTLRRSYCMRRFD